MIVRGTLADTDYESFKTQLEDLEKDRLEKERKQREISKRSNFHYEFEEFEDDYKDTDAPVQGSNSIFNLPLVSLIMLILFGSYLYFKRSSSSDNFVNEIEDDKDD